MNSVSEMQLTGDMFVYITVECDKRQKYMAALND